MSHISIRKTVEALAEDAAAGAIDDPAAPRRAAGRFKATGVKGEGCVEISIGAATARVPVADLAAAAAVADLPDPSAPGDAARRASVEFVSAYPSAPLGSGDAQAAVIGDAIARLLERDGWRATREYFVNDAGQQIDTLTRIVFSAYFAALEDGTGALDGSPDYVRDVAQELMDARGNALAEMDEAAWFPIVKDAALASILAGVRSDLARLGVEIDRYQSESSLRRAGVVETAVGAATSGGEAPALGGDDAPALKMANGEWTYLAADIAYHFDRIERGATRIVDVLRTDHARHSETLRAIFAGGSLGDVDLSPRLVAAARDGEGSGQVPLRAAVEGRDPNALRLWLLSHDVETRIDLAKTLETAPDRVSGPLERLRSALSKLESGAPSGGADELIPLLAAWPANRRLAIAFNEPELVGRFLCGLADLLHAAPFASFADPDDEAVAQAIARAIRFACADIGVDPDA